MTLEAQGAYVRLLAYEWQDGSIPAEIGQLARLCGVNPKKMAVLWDSFLRGCFTPLADHPDLLANGKLEMVRQEQVDYRRSKAEAGRRGGVRSGEARRQQTARPAEANTKQTARRNEAQPAETASKNEANAKQTRSKDEANLKQAGSKSEANGKQTPSKSEAEGQANVKQNEALQSASASASASASPRPVFNSSPRVSGRPGRGPTDAPTEFEISEQMREWANAEGFDNPTIAQETAMMLDHFRGKGQRRTDWVATWRNWLRRERKYGGSGNGKQRQYESPAQARMRRQDEAEARVLAKFEADGGGVPH